MLQPVEHFLAAVADDFTEPHTAVHRNEQRAFANAGRLGMGGNIGIKELVPDLDDFGLSPAAVNAIERY